MKSTGRSSTVSRALLLRAALGMLTLTSPMAAHAFEDHIYGANIGWINTRPDNAPGLSIHRGFLSGMLYSASVGWIDLGNGTPGNGPDGYSNATADDCGVNQKAGSLSGFAYGANIGWINFGWAAADDPNRPRMDVVTGAASGFAWSANVGWISLADLLVSGVAPSVGLIGAAPAAVAGMDVELRASATENEDLGVQWFFNGVAIPGANGRVLRLTRTQYFQAGDYSVVITRADGSALTVAPFSLAVDKPAPSGARLTNLSARAVSRTGASVLIPGFVISGSTDKDLLLRVVGPGLGKFGVSNTMENPRLLLKRLAQGNYVDVAQNDDWMNSDNAVELALTSDSVGAFELEVGSRDAALLRRLSPGQYTLVADGVAGSEGVALVELYDTDAANPGSALINLSARTYVGEGAEAPVPGFVVSPEGPLTLLVRVVGPTLAGFGIEEALTDPRLTLYSGSEPIFANDDWGAETTASTIASVAAQVGAFPLPQGSKDAALVVTLPPGAYTVIASSANGPGIALVEVYQVP